MIRKIGVSFLLTIYMLTFVAVACEYPLASGEKKGQAVLTFDKEVLKKVLVEDGYKESDIDIKNNRINKINIKLQPVLDAYLFDRTIASDFNVEGLTMKIIMEKYSCNFWNALGFMDSYIDDPERAKRLIDAAPFHYGVRHR